MNKEDRGAGCSSVSFLCPYLNDSVDAGDCMNSDNALNEALVAFGANRGDCEIALQKSLEMLNQDPGIGEIDAATPVMTRAVTCLLYTSPSPRDATLSRMPSSA